MNRRTFLRGVGAASLTALASTAVAARTAVGPDDSPVAFTVTDDCSCEGTYEACCVDGPCDCRVQGVR